MTFHDFILWLNDSQFSVYLRESEIAFPLTEATHLIGIGISVGMIMWIDLRLLGLTLRGEKVSDIVGRAEPWGIVGFVIMFVSGILLFLGKPETYWGTTTLKVKLVLMVAAGLNVWFFHTSVFPKVAKWDEGPTPLAAKLVGLSSLALWFIVIILGRWTAYYADPLYTGGIRTYLWFK